MQPLQTTPHWTGKHTPPCRQKNVHTVKEVQVLRELLRLGCLRLRAAVDEVLQSLGALLELGIVCDSGLQACYGGADLV